jgi:hypothetical protein
MCFRANIKKPINRATQEIVGRKNELETLERVYNSNKSE